MSQLSRGRVKDDDRRVVATGDKFSITRDSCCRASRASARSLFRPDQFSSLRVPHLELSDDRALADHWRIFTRTRSACKKTVACGNHGGATEIPVLFVFWHHQLA